MPGTSANTISICVLLHLLVLLQVSETKRSSRVCGRISRVVIWSNDTGIDSRPIGQFCHGTVVYSAYVVLPAHCLVAHRYLKDSYLRVHNKDQSIRKSKIYYSPTFQLKSFTEYHWLVNDIAIIELSEPLIKKRQRPVVLFEQRNKRQKHVSGGHGRIFSVLSPYDCDTMGLDPNQQCYETKTIRKIKPLCNQKNYSFSDPLKLDPRITSYREKCWHVSGKAMFSFGRQESTTSLRRSVRNLPSPIRAFNESGKFLRSNKSLRLSCTLVGLILMPGSRNNNRTFVTLDMGPHSQWIKHAIVTDLLLKSEKPKSKALRRLVYSEMLRSKHCPQSGKKPTKESLRIPAPTMIVEPEAPEFHPIHDNLKVITECGVEVRLESGIIHSPIHYRDVDNTRQLINIFQTNYKYRPKQRCEWLITAPSTKDKVGVKFQYFDLHPEYDRLDVEGGGARRPDVDTFRGGKQTRTIISGTDRLRLTFHSDHSGERRGFSLMFQRVSVSQCGGSYLAQRGTIQSPNYPFFYPPETECHWKIEVPGPATIKLEFDVVNLHLSDLLEIRDGLDEKSTYITSVTGNKSRLIFSTSNKMYIHFKSNDWGQLAGFSARFYRAPPLCGDQVKLWRQSVSISAPRLYPQGSYRRGYMSCKWEILASPRHYIIAKFSDFDLGQQSQCATGFVELSDGSRDSDHTRRYCVDMANKAWYTSSNRMYVEYFFNLEHVNSVFTLRVDQTRGCVLPRLPDGGDRIVCKYLNDRTVECTLTCTSGLTTSTTCYLHHGAWSSTLKCGIYRPKHLPHDQLLERIGQCRHRRNTGCLMPPAMEETTIQCKVEKKRTVCHVDCGSGMISPGDFASCETDLSGWEARWSRVLLQCQPDCSRTIPGTRRGRINCQQSSQHSLTCSIKCKGGYVASLYGDPVAPKRKQFDCYKGVWTGVLTCVKVKRRYRI